MAEPQADAAVSEPGRVASVPHKWLFGLAALIIVPWLIAAGIYARSIRTASGAPAGAEAGATVGTPQPWGELETTPIVISPPLEYVPNNWGPIESPHWVIPQIDRSQLEQFLLSVGFGQEDVRTLLAASRPESQIQGFVVSPDPSFVRKIDPQVRAALYTQLAKVPLNERQKGAYRNFSPSAEAWLGRSPISQRTLSLVSPLVYRSGDFVYFADIDLVRSELNDAQELQRLAKGLLRESTLLVRLRVPDVTRIDEVADYWGRGGRRTDIRPLLESIAASGPAQSIDISLLLPPLARQHLYRYPQISLKDFDKPFANCFWTALNFFNAAPDDRLLDSNYAIQRLKNDYYLVNSNYQLGDIVAFSDAQGQYFHAAVYLADNLVFGKNGLSSLAPWTIVPIDRLKGYYNEYADSWNIMYYRRKDF